MESIFDIWLHEVFLLKWRWYKIMAGTIPHFLLFFQLSLNQQKVFSSNQLGEYEFFSIQIQTRKCFSFFLFWPRIQGHQNTLHCRPKDIWSKDNKILLLKVHLTVAPEMKGKWLIISVLCLRLFLFFFNIRRESAEHKSNSKDEGQLEYCCTTTYKENSCNVF